MGEAKRFGRYEVRDTIGRGAMGAVYLAEDPVIRRQVAIKVVEAHPAIDERELEQLRARFEREFQSAGRLSHPNIVGVHDVGQENGDSFIAMEYVPGESLQAILKQGRVFSFKEIADLAAQLSSGLDYAHEFGIVHRDIKPANILITPDGRPKITDFGVAKVATTTLTRTGTVVGTPAYMSPEQVTGHPVSGAADQFSLAVMVYQMLTGERPFAGESPTTIMYKIVHEEPVRPSALNVTLPEPVDDALIRALSKRPEDRYPTCMELAEALRAALGAKRAEATVVMTTGSHEATVATGTPVLRQPERPARAVKKKDNPRVARLAAAAIVVVAAALATWAYSMGTFENRVDADTLAAAALDTVASGESPAPVTHWLDIEAGEGWRIWLNGADTGTVTPASVSISGLVGDPQRVELRAEGRESVADTFILDEDPPASWAPQEAAVSASELVSEEGSADDLPAAEPPLAFTVVSYPPGARVTFDGEVLDGVTPVEIAVDPANKHSVAIDLQGYEPTSWAFGLDDLTESHRETGRLEFPLQPSTPPGFVILDSPSYPVVVKVTSRDGGAPLSRDAASAHEIRLMPGRYTIELSAPSVHWRGERQDVVVESGGSQSLQVPPAVTVQVSAIPGNCTVSIDGVEVGPTPFPQRITVGLHRFTFNWGAIGQGSKDLTVNITSNNQRVAESAGSSR